MDNFLIVIMTLLETLGYAFIICSSIVGLFVAIFTMIGMI